MWSTQKTKNKCCLEQVKFFLIYIKHIFSFDSFTPMSRWHDIFTIIYQLAWFEPVASFYYFPLKTKLAYYFPLKTKSAYKQNCSFIWAIVKTISPLWSWDYNTISLDQNTKSIIVSRSLPENSKQALGSPDSLLIYMACWFGWLLTLPWAVTSGSWAWEYLWKSFMQVLHQFSLDFQDFIWSIV